MASLENNETQAINLFIEEAIDNPFVEGILLFPHTMKDKKTLSISILAIINNSLSYCQQVSGEPFIPKQAVHLKNIRALCCEYNLKFENTRLSFDIMDKGKFNFKLLHQEELDAIKKLLSSTVLYDRFDDIKSRKKRDTKFVKGYENVVQIDNVSLVTRDNDSNKSLKKVL